MRLVFVTKDLSLAGRTFEGFPLLIGSEGWPVEPAQSFLWHTLIESGEALSDLTQTLSVANHYRNFRDLRSGSSDMTEKTGMLGSSYSFLTEGQHGYQVALLSPSVEPHDQGQAIVHRAGIKC